MKLKQLLSVTFTVAVCSLAGTTLLTKAETTPHSRTIVADGLSERVDGLDARVKAVEGKSERAVLEADYIERVQKQYEAYYEKAFNSQVWTLGIMGVILTAVFGLTARFGLGVFDRRIEASLNETSAQLRTEFTRTLRMELDTLRETNASQIKELEDRLTSQVSEQEAGLKVQANFQFQFAQGLTAMTAGEHTFAIRHFRNALGCYKDARSKQPIEKPAGVRTIANIFMSMHPSDPVKFVEEARKELATELYKGLEDELALAALELPELGPLLRR